MFPEPREGLVVRYSYLWDREYRAGRQEGSKDRPCAIVVSVVIAHGERQVIVVPITHAAPRAPGDALEIPPAIRNRLGLGAEQSWIVVAEANRFTWPGPDLIPIPGHDVSTVAYGMLPSGFFGRVREAFLARFSVTRKPPVPRAE